MKKDEFIAQLMERCELEKKQATCVFDEFCKLIITTLKSGDEVALPIGKFVLKKRPPRTARNPVTGAEVKVPAKIVPAFKPSKAFKDGVAG